MPSQDWSDGFRRGLNDAFCIFGRAVEAAVKGENVAQAILKGAEEILSRVDTELRRDFDKAAEEASTTHELEMWREREALVLATLGSARSFLTTIDAVLDAGFKEALERIRVEHEKLERERVEREDKKREEEREKVELQRKEDERRRLEQERTREEERRREDERTREDREKQWDRER